MTLKFKVALTLVFIYFSLLPIQWIRVRVFGLNELVVGHFHIVGFFLVLMLPLLVLKSRINRETIHFVTLAALFIFFGMAVTQLLDYPFFSLTAISRQFFYLLVSIVIILTVSQLPDKFLNRLVFLGPVVTVVYSLGFYYSAKVGGIQLFGLLKHSLQSGDIDALLFQVFKNTMNATAFDLDSEVRSNIRHGIASAVFTASIISLAFISEVKKNYLKAIILSGVFLNIIFIILTLSRSNILALALTLFIMYFFMQKHGDLNNKSKLLKIYIVYILSPIAIAIALNYFGILDIIFERFFSTNQGQSYDERWLLLAESYEHISNNIFIPASIDSIEKIDPHNIMLSSWLASGFIGFLFTGLFWCYLVWIFLSNLISINKVNKNYILMYLGATSLLTLPIIRSITAGSGLDSASWATIAVSIGILSRKKSLAVKLLTN